MSAAVHHPLILHIETSGAVCSVAVSRGLLVLGEKASADRYDHSALLVPHIRDVLRQTGLPIESLDAVAISAGPGSYTGLRVGTSTAKSICYAHEIPLIAVPTLEAVAYEAMVVGSSADLYFPVLDARRMEVYISAFDGVGNRLLRDMALELTPETFEPLLKAGEKIMVCGPAAAKCAQAQALPERDTRHFEVFARHLVRPAVRRYLNAQFSDNVAFTPTYVKAPNITKSSKALF